jgi:hypothetical protein
MVAERKEEGKRIGDSKAVCLQVLSLSQWRPSADTIRGWVGGIANLLTAREGQWGGGGRGGADPPLPNTEAHIPHAAPSQLGRLYPQMLTNWLDC